MSGRGRYIAQIRGMERQRRQVASFRYQLALLQADLAALSSLSNLARATITIELFRSGRRGAGQAPRSRPPGMPEDEE